MMINKEATTFKHLTKEDRRNFLNNSADSFVDFIDLEIASLKNKFEKEHKINFLSENHFRRYLLENLSSSTDINEYILHLFVIKEKLNLLKTTFDKITSSLTIKEGQSKLANSIIEIVNDLLSVFVQRISFDIEEKLKEIDIDKKYTSKTIKIKSAIVDLDNFINNKVNINKIKFNILKIEDFLEKLFIKSDFVIDNVTENKIKELHNKYISFNYLKEIGESRDSNLEFSILEPLFSQLSKDLSEIYHSLLFGKDPSQDDFTYIGEDSNFSYNEINKIFTKSSTFEEFKSLDDKIVSKISNLLSKNNEESQTILRYLRAGLMDVFDVVFDIYQKGNIEKINRGNCASIIYKVMFNCAKILKTYNSSKDHLIVILYGSKNEIIKKLKETKIPNFFDFMLSFFEQMKTREDIAHVYVDTGSYDKSMFDCVALKIDSSVSRECYKAYFSFLAIMNPIITVDIRKEEDINEVIDVINLEIELREDSIKQEEISNKFKLITRDLYNNKEDLINDFKKIVSFLRNPKTPINVLKNNVALFRKLTSASSLISNFNVSDNNDKEKYKQITLKEVAEDTMDNKLKQLAEKYPDAEKLPTLYLLDNIDLGNGFVTEVLQPGSNRYFSIGRETQCCQGAGLAGENAMIDSYINPLAAVLLLNYNETLISQSYFHCTVLPNEEFGIILDNVEVSADAKYLPRDVLDVVYNKLAIHATKKLGFKYFVCGTGYNKLNNSRFSRMKFKSDPRYFSVDRPYTDFNYINGNIDLTKFNKEYSYNSKSNNNTTELDLERKPLTHNIRLK